MSKHAATRGFLPDFSEYIEKHYPVKDAYENKVMINKLGDFLKVIITTKNPPVDLRGIGCKVEKLDAKIDSRFFSRCSGVTVLPKLALYYLSFGNNPLGIAVGFDTAKRVAYILAIDCHHAIRAWHGKLG